MSLSILNEAKCRRTISYEFEKEEKKSQKKKKKITDVLEPVRLRDEQQNNPRTKKRKQKLQCVGVKDAVLQLLSRTKSGNNLLSLAAFTYKRIKCNI